MPADIANNDLQLIISVGLDIYEPVVIVLN